MGKRRKRWLVALSVYSPRLGPVGKGTGRGGGPLRSASILRIWRAVWGPAVVWVDNWADILFEIFWEIGSVHEEEVGGERGLESSGAPFTC